MWNMIAFPRRPRLAAFLLSLGFSVTQCLVPFTPIAIAGGWAANGIALTPSDSAQYEVVIAPDGAGGAIFAWEDRRGVSFDCYAQHLTASP